VRYQDFLASKARTCAPVGFEPQPVIAPLFPFQHDLVRWSVRQGRAALFADTGLGKTRMQLEWARQVVLHTEGRVLILAPLAVAAQTCREAASFGLEVTHNRNGTLHDGITITNYEQVEKFDVSDLAGIVLDESSILKHQDSKTRGLLVESFAKTPYRLACTATPAPNDQMELGNHSEFLGVMSLSEMLATFFTHDGGETQKWRLKRHGREDFWRWVCSWAAVVRRPSDLGYDDGAFELPPLVYHEHVVPSEPSDAGLLVAVEAYTLQEQRAERKASIDARVRVAAEMVNASIETWILWCDLNAESEALHAAIPDSIEVTGSQSVETKESLLTQFSEGRARVIVSKSSIAGFGLNWQHCHNVLFVGVTHSFEAWYQAIRRCWRFGQKFPVNCHVVIADSEGAVVANLKRKGRQADEMAQETEEHVRAFVQKSVLGSERRVLKYAPRVPMTLPPWIQQEMSQ